MADNRRLSKRAVAAQAWRLLLDCTLAQLEQVAGVVRGLGLSAGDVRALLVLDREEPRPMGWLAQAWHCDASNVTWMVDRLQERGLVERRTQPTDRRVKAVVLTELGGKAKAEVLSTLYEPPAGLIGLDRPGLDALRDLLARLSPSPSPSPGLPGWIGRQPAAGPALAIRQPHGQDG
jgi:DNA-binding MarR family transcriptional regulator